MIVLPGSCVVSVAVGRSFTLSSVAVTLRTVAKPSGAGSPSGLGGCGGQAGDQELL